MKNIILLLVACASLSSCAQLDSMLVKNTGLTSTDAILLGVKAKERIDLTLKEYNNAKNRNLPSGKEVVEVVVDPGADVANPVSKPSMIDSVLSVFGF
jgi:hypothetical protein